MEQLERLNIGGLECLSVTARKATRPVAAGIFCHGFGAPGTDLVPLAAELLAEGGPELERMRFLFPAAPIELDPAYDGRCWWPINMERMMTALAAGKLTELSSFVPEQLPACRSLIRGVVDWCRAHDGTPSERVLLGGFSQGAMLAADVALSLGGKTGGLSLWSGMLINRPEWSRWATSARKMTVVQSHGQLDPVLPYACGEELRDLLMAAGHAVEFISFRGYHQIPAGAIQATARLAAALCETVES
jgi:phospholipase/carboxylesterase